MQMDAAFDRASRGVIVLCSVCSPHIVATTQRWRVELQSANAVRFVVSLQKMLQCADRRSRNTAELFVMRQELWLDQNVLCFTECSCLRNPSPKHSTNFVHFSKCFAPISRKLNPFMDLWLLAMLPLSSTHLSVHLPICSSIHLPPIIHLSIHPSLHLLPLMHSNHSSLHLVCLPVIFKKLQSAWPNPQKCNINLLSDQCPSRPDIDHIHIKCTTQNPVQYILQQPTEELKALWRPCCPGGDQME